MAKAMEDTLAVPDKRAAELAGISMKQLPHWEKTGLVVPSIMRQISPRNIVRLYSFQDLLELLVVAELRHRPGISLKHIRRLIAYLRDRNFDAPLRELKFATRGQEIYIQYPDGSYLTRLTRTISLAIATLMSAWPTTSTSTTAMRGLPFVKKHTKTFSEANDV